MNVLAIETSGPVASVAACRDADLVAGKSCTRGMEHGRMLVPLIDEVVQQAGWQKQNDLDLITVSIGPGSFTGLRVGLAAARTLALFLGVPLVGVCSFDALAHNAPQEHDRILTALDAKRGDIYAAAYERREKSVLQRTTDPAVCRPGEAAKWHEGRFVILGDAIRVHSDALTSSGGQPAPEKLWQVRAEVIAQLGLQAFRKGRIDDPLKLEPIYLRLPEAEEKRLARERGDT